MQTETKEPDSSSHQRSIPAFTLHQKGINEYFRTNSRYWLDIYSDGTLDCETYQERRRAVLSTIDSIGLPPDSKVLEVGCGAGLVTAELARRKYKVTAVDAVEEMLQLTRSTAIEAGVNEYIETGVEDVTELSFGSDTFRLVVAVGVIPWVFQEERAITEMTRVLRRGGYLVITADHYWCLTQVLDPRCFPPMRPLRYKVAEALEKLHLRPHRQPRFRRHTRKQFDALLARAGIEKLKGITVGFGPFTFMNKRLFPDSTGIRIHRMLQRLADRGFPIARSTGMEYVVLGKRI